MGVWPGSNSAALSHRTSLWWLMTAVRAEWNTEMRRSGVRRPSGRSHSAGAVRRCEVRRLRLCGFPREVNSEDAVPRMLGGREQGRCELGGGKHTAGCPAGRCTSAATGGASKASDRLAWRQDGASIPPWCSRSRDGSFAVMHTAEDAPSQPRHSGEAREQRGSTSTSKLLCTDRHNLHSSRTLHGVHHRRRREQEALVDHHSKLCCPNEVCTLPPASVHDPYPLLTPPLPAS